MAQSHGEQFGNVFVILGIVVILLLFFQIPHGKKCGKDWLMQNLQQCGTPFVPFHFHTESHSSVFYVNDRLQANSLRALSRQIDQPSGHKVKVQVQ